MIKDPSGRIDAELHSSAKTPLDCAEEEDPQFLPLEWDDVPASDRTAFLLYTQTRSTVDHLENFGMHCGCFCFFADPT